MALLALAARRRWRCPGARDEGEGAELEAWALRAKSSSTTGGSQSAAGILSGGFVQYQLYVSATWQGAAGPCRSDETARSCDVVERRRPSPRSVALDQRLYHPFLYWRSAGLRLQAELMDGRGDGNRRGAKYVPVMKAFSEALWTIFRPANPEGSSPAGAGVRGERRRGDESRLLLERRDLQKSRRRLL